jgi:hypothetical protein
MDPANQNFELLDNFIVETKSRSLVMHFGEEDPAVIPTSICRISPFFLYQHNDARTVEFESPSRITEFGKSAFKGSFCHEIRRVPASVKLLPTK